MLFHINFLNDHTLSFTNNTCMPHKKITAVTQVPGRTCHNAYQLQIVHQFGHQLLQWRLELNFRTLYFASLTVIYRTTKLLLTPKVIRSSIE